MSTQNQVPRKGSSGLESLEALPTIRAAEFADWASQDDGLQGSPTPRSISPFSTDQVYRFCQAVVNHPMQPSSAYPKLAGVSPKSAKPVRRELTEKGLIREHIVDSGGRGRNTILLEALPAGIEAVARHNATRK